jgi:signal transduction histidine kinase
VNNSIEAFSTIEDGRIKDIVITLRGDKQKVLLTIEDNGCGIPLKNQARIFDPFFSTKISEGGCGLGLPYIKEIIETEMKGKITVESQINIGTKFTVIIPL